MVKNLKGLNVCSVVIILPVISQVWMSITAMKLGKQKKLSRISYFSIAREIRSGKNAVLLCSSAHRHSFSLQVWQWTFYFLLFIFCHLPRVSSLRRSGWTCWLGGSSTTSSPRTSGPTSLGVASRRSSTVSRWVRLRQDSITESTAVVK